MKKHNLLKILVTILLVVTVGGGVFLAHTQGVNVFANGTSTEQVKETRSEKLHSETLATGPLYQPASITFFTHGYGGGFDAWGSTKSESLLQRLIAQTNADVYYIKLKEFDEDSNGNKTKNIVYKTYKTGKVGDRDFGNPDYIASGLLGVPQYDMAVQKAVHHDSAGKIIYDSLLYDPVLDAGLESGTYRSRDGEIENFKLLIEKRYPINDTAEKIKARTTFDNFNKHNIIIFEATNTYISHYAMYEEVNAILDQISSDFKQVKGEIPKVNLIGHSRGGVVNIMYATAHPYSVASVYSVDTPYTGINIGKLLNLPGMDGVLNGVSTLFGVDTSMFSTAGTQDFLNPYAINAVRDAWNTAVDMPGVNINANAIGSAATWDYVTMGALYGAYNAYCEILKKTTDNINNIPDISNIELSDMLSMVLDLTPETLKMALWLGIFDILEGIALEVSIIAYTADFLLGWINGDIGDSAAELFLHTKLITVSTMIIIALSPLLELALLTTLAAHWSDAMPALLDAIQNGDLSVIPFIIGSVGRLAETVAIPITLIIGVAQMIIEMLEVKNGEILINDDIFIDLPSQLATGFDGFERFYIRHDASDYSRTDFIAHGDVSLHGYAMWDTRNIDYILNGLALSDRQANDQIESMFTFEPVTGGVRITGLKSGIDPSSLIIPNELYGEKVVSIDGAAFRNRGNLKTVLLCENLREIRDGAFLGCVKLEAFAFWGATESQYYTVENGILYSKDKTVLVNYPSGKTEKGYVVPASVTTIGNYALIANPHLQSVDLNQAQTLGKGVFSECTNLSSITSTSLAYVADASVQDTSWFLDAIGERVTLGSVLIAYRGTASTLYLDGYTSVGDRAFVSSPNLKEIFILGNSDGKTVDAAAGVLDGSAVEKVYVPTLNALWYQANMSWSQYADKIAVHETAITFNTDGGTLRTNVNVEYYGHFDVVNPIKTGYLFLNWIDGDGNTYERGDYWKDLRASVTLTAIYEANTYILTYDADGGIILKKGSETIVYNGSIALPTSQKDGYELSYWLGDDGKVYYDGKIYQTDGDITLVAVWERVVFDITYVIYTVIIDGQYDTRADYTLIDGQDLPNYRFLYWYETDNKVAVSFLLKGSIGNRIFYAQLDDILTLNFDPNDGTGYKFSIRGTQSEIEAMSLPTSIRGGYKGVWIWTESDGIERSIAFGVSGYKIKINGITLVAKWTEKSFAECLIDGTQTYEIYTENQLIGFKTFCDADTSSNMSGKTIRLMCSISLGNSWLPINSFGGVLDGNGKTIANMSIVIQTGKANSDGYFGMFGSLYGTVQNLTLSSLWIESAIIDNSQHDGSYWYFVGGVTGLLRTAGRIDNVVVTGSVYSRRTQSSAGGISGYTRGIITNSSYIGGELLGNGDLGGITGTLQGGTVSVCKVIAAIHSYIVKANRSIGGIVGYAYSGSTISDTEVTATNIYFDGYGLMDGQDLNPNMGFVVGRLNASTLVGAVVSGSNLYAGSLSSSYEYDIKRFLGIKISSKTANQKKYFGAARNGNVGCEG